MTARVKLTNLRTAPTRPMQLGRGYQRILVEGEDAQNVDVHVNVLKAGSGSGPYHYHARSENIYTVLAGTIEAIVEGTRYLLRENDVAFIPPGVHRSPPSRGFTCRTKSSMPRRSRPWSSVSPVCCCSYSRTRAACAYRLTRRPALASFSRSQASSRSRSALSSLGCVCVTSTMQRPPVSRWWSRSRSSWLSPCWRGEGRTRARSRGGAGPPRCIRDWLEPCSLISCSSVPFGATAR